MARRARRALPVRRGLQVAAGLVLLGVFAVASWAVTDFAFHRTAGADFCAGCHTMEPMTRAWRDDVHGGSNPHGLEAQCVDCHLSHSSPLAYFYTKAVFGLNDVYSQTFKDVYAIDWHALRERRESYVFDSGCLECHANLENAQRTDNKALVAHRPYFLGRIDKQCVSCHQHVGHRNLGTYLNAHFNEGGGE